MQIAWPVLLWAIVANAGCVIPLAPEFEDPPPRINYAPEIESAIPALWSTATAAPDAEVEFSVTLFDPNLEDTLYVRWLSDYPPRTGDTRFLSERSVPPAADGRAQRSTVMYAPKCMVDSIARGLKSHRIVVLVADRPFTDPDTPGLPNDEPYSVSTSQDANVVRGGWNLNLECK